MIPVLLDGARLRIALFGNETRTVRRLALLREGGAGNVAVFATRPSGELVAAAGDALRIAGTRARSILRRIRPRLCRRPRSRCEAAALAARARAAGKLVNVEDDRAHCDFHTPAVDAARRAHPDSVDRRPCARPLRCSRGLSRADFRLGLGDPPRPARSKTARLARRAGCHPAKSGRPWAARSNAMAGCWNRAKPQSETVPIPALRLDAGNRNIS